MNDAECVNFLQWALPRLQMRWRGFRRVRRQVRRRVNARVEALGLADAEAYRAYLEAHPDEWVVLDALCRVTISRFYRNRRIYDCLLGVVLPALAEPAVARGDEVLRVWSLGCASGEEPYTLALGWRQTQPDASVAIDILAMDADEHMIARAKRAVYPPSSLRELPRAWRTEAFYDEDGTFRLRASYRESVTFRLGDVRTAMPAGPFDLVLCRNLVFTYFDESLQRRLLRDMAGRLVPGGALVLGSHETLPEGAAGFAEWTSCRGVHRHTDEKQEI